MNRRRLLAPAALAALAVAATSHAAVPSGNLLANPDADADVPSESTDPLPGWTVADLGAREQAYGSTGFPTTDVAQANNGGGCFFFAGQTASNSFTQDIDVSGSAAEIDGGSVNVLAGGQFGGYQDQTDHAELTVEFRNAGNTAVGTALTVGGVTPADRNNETTLLLRQGTATVPNGTRKLHVVLTSTRDVGDDNDGYSDNLFVTFNSSYTIPASSRRCPTAVTPTPTPTPSPSPSPTPSATPSATPTPPPVPTLPPKLSAIVTLPSNHKCLSKRSFKIRLHNPSGTKITSAVVSLNGKRIATRSGARLTAPVNLKNLVRGTYTVKIVAKLANGTTVVGTRTYHTCARHRTGSKPKL